MLPALALAYARRVDLAGRGPPRSSHHLPRHNGGGSRGSPCCSVRSLLHLLLSPLYLFCAGGYFPWAVSGYALGLVITQAANVYGWTFNDVQGQPALLYLVPGVLGSQLLRAAICGEVAAVWTGHVLMVGEGGGQEMRDGDVGAASPDTAALLHGGSSKCCCDPYKRL